jgi:hypothetical protein
LSGNGKKKSNGIRRVLRSADPWQTCAEYRAAPARDAKEEKKRGMEMSGWNRK